MKKIIIIFLIFVPSLCFAEVTGYLFVGKYLKSDYFDLEKKHIRYRAGIHLEITTVEKGPILFLEDETLMENMNDNGFKPSQINYKIGLNQKINQFNIIIKHECLHPVDGKSNGTAAQSYTLIEGRFNF